MSLNPRLGVSFNGDCEAAFRFYERCLNAKIAFLLRYGDSPMANVVPEDFKDKILHARLDLGDSAILGDDARPGAYEGPRGFSILISPGDPAETDRLFHALSEGGTIVAPLQATFWARRFGVVTDRFGICWTINCEQAVEQAG